MSAHEEVEVTDRRRCQFCFAPATIDGATKYGPWANMCTACHAEVGVGVGLGKGQRLIYVGKQ